MGSSFSRSSPSDQNVAGDEENEAKNKGPTQKKGPLRSTVTALSSTLETLKPQKFTEDTSLIPLIGLTVITTLTLAHLYRRNLTRVPNTPLIPPQYYRSRFRSLHGTVTSVGDGDNFRLYHTPGGRFLGWGWLSLPGIPFLGGRQRRGRGSGNNSNSNSDGGAAGFRRVPSTRAELKDQTIHVRIAGVDAPELPHFGHQGQPGGQEALDWLKSYVLGRKVRVWCYRRDQYDRVVGTAFLWRWGRRRDVGAEMLKSGWATVYEARTGSEFGGREAWYRRLEQRAKRKGKGIWAGEEAGFESPRDFKNRIKSEEEKVEGKGKERDSKKGGLWARISGFIGGGKR